MCPLDHFSENSSAAIAAHWRPVANAIHVWSVQLGPSADERDRTLLSHDERKRAERFARERDRAAWIQSHAWWRRIVGHYLQLPAAAIRVTYGAFGAPRCDPFLHQSLSHADGLALIAISLRARGNVGIDVERLRPLGTTEISRLMLSRAEQSRLVELPSADRAALLLRIWTRKEAWLKALGCGLYLSPCAFEVGLEAPGRIVSTELDPAITADWLTCELNIGHGYAAALAGRAPLPQISQWTIGSYGDFESVISKMGADRLHRP